MASTDRQGGFAAPWLKKLRERKLVQWAIAYGAGAWLVLQVLDTIGPRWGLTEWHTRVLDIVLVVGFFVALVLAWYHGEQGRQRVSGPELLIVGALLLIGGIALQYLRVDSTTTTTAQSAEDANSEAPSQPAQFPLKSIAVLPFDNYSPSPHDEYFAAGVTEEITSQLSRIGDLTVLSRVAVERAMESEDSLDGVARRLRAGSVLEGSVRMAGSRVRITAQLIDMRDGRHLWSESFDRELSDIFQIQTDVAIAIGEALLATLSSGERKRIETPITENLRAYQLYLRQNALAGNVPDENAQAIELLEEAVQLDPGFATALARLSWRFVWRYRIEGDIALARTALSLAQDALAMDPQLGYAWFALASAHLALDQYSEAFPAFDKALDLDPTFTPALNDASYFGSLRAQFVDALDRAFRAVRISPNDANTRWHALVPLLYLGDHERAEAWLDLAAAEGMEFHRLDIARVYVEMQRGNVAAAIELTNALIREHVDEPEAETWGSSILFTLGDWRSVRDSLEARGAIHRIRPTRTRHCRA